MQLILLVGLTRSLQVNGQYLQFCIIPLGGGDFIAASQADMGARVVVAMETVNNPAAYTGARARVHAPIKALKYSSFYSSVRYE